MDIESAGFGAGGGIFGALLAYFGVSRRIDRVEAILDKNVVYRDTCNECKSARDQRFEAIEKSQNERYKMLDSKLDYIIERLDARGSDGK